MSAFVHRELLLFVTALLLVTGKNAFVGIRFTSADAPGSLADKGKKLPTKGHLP